MYTAEVTKRRKLVLALSGLVAVLIASAVIAVHSPRLQRRVWQAVTATLEESSGVRIEAGDVRLRPLPASLVLRTLTVSMEGKTLLTVEEIRADWTWRGLATRPRRIENIAVRTPVFFGDALPPTGSESDTPSEIDLWGLLEIGSLEVSGGSASGGAADVRVVLAEVSMQAQLVGRSAAAAVEAGRLVLNRLERELVFGPLTLEVEASAEGVVVQNLDIRGGAAGLSAVGRVAASPEMAGRFETEIEADLPSVAAWWDPNLVTGLAPEGRARLVGNIGLVADGRVAGRSRASWRSDVAGGLRFRNP